MVSDAGHSHRVRPCGGIPRTGLEQEELVTLTGSLSKRLAHMVVRGQLFRPGAQLAAATASEVRPSAEKPDDALTVRDLIEALGWHTHS